MEAATLRRGGPASIVQSLRVAARERSRAFWIVAGLVALGAALRFATLGVQTYHHDEVVTAARILRGSFGHAMNAVGFSESAPPLYYALAWLWTQVFGDSEVGLRSLSALAGMLTIPVAYLIGAELRGRRAGILSAALVAVNPMMLWYSQEARAYALLVLFCAVSLLFCLRALRYGRRRDVIWWGVFAALALATHYFALFAVAAEVLLLLRMRRGRAALPGLAVIAGACLLLLPLALRQMSYGHAEWIGNQGLAHRLWETGATFLSGETADVIGRADRPLLAVLPFALAVAALGLLLWRGSREERRAAALPLLVAAAAIGIPLALALLSAGKDFVLARNVMPALLPLLVAVAIGCTTAAAPRLGRAIAVGLVVYSLGFCVWASADPQLQRPDWSAVAERLGEAEEPRALVTWTLGEAPLRYELPHGAFQVRAKEGYGWLVGEVDFISDGVAPQPAPALLGPGFRESAREDTGRLVIRRYRTSGPGLRPLRLRQLRKADLNWRTTGVLLDGVGPR